MKRSCEEDPLVPIIIITPEVFVLEETRALILTHAVTKGVFHTYAALLCVSSGFYATVSSLIRSHFTSDAIQASNSLILHSASPCLKLSCWTRITDDTIRQISTRLTDLTLHCNARMRGSTLKRLTGLTRLSLSVKNMFIQWRHVSYLTALTDLNLHGWHLLVTSDVAKMTQLRKLNLYSDQVIESHALHTLTGLESLDLAGESLIESHSLLYLDRCLTRLNLLSNTVIDDSGLVGLTSLKSLRLGGKPGQVTGHSVSRLTQLTSLRLQDVDRVSDDELTVLTNLCELCLSYNTRITDLGLCPLTGLTSLRLMKNTTITDAGIRTLTRLNTLYLSTQSPVSPHVVSSLSLLTSLVNTV